MMSRSRYLVALVGREVHRDDEMRFFFYDSANERKATARALEKYREIAPKRKVVHALAKVIKPGFEHIEANAVLAMASEAMGKQLRSVPPRA